MNHPEEAPKLSKLPFIAGDLLLIATAVGIGVLTPAPIGPIALLAIGLCVIIGSALLVIPFVADYARRQDALLTERQNQIAALARTTADSAEQIAIATAGLHSLAESSAQNLKSLEKLPLQLQERIDAIAQQLTSAKAPASPEAAPSPTVAKASKEELARLEAASEKIARTLAQLETAAQSKTDATESTGKALADLLTRATSQVEALAFAAAAASAVAAESTAQLLSERAAATASATTAANALETLAARAETLQLPIAPPVLPTSEAPLVTIAEEGLSGDNADGNDGVFTPPAPAEKPDDIGAEISAEGEINEHEVALEDAAEDEALTDEEAALDEAPSAATLKVETLPTDDAGADDHEIEEDETEEDLAEERDALAVAKTAETPTDSKDEADADEADDASEDEEDETDDAESDETDEEKPPGGTDSDDDDETDDAEDAEDGTAETTDSTDEEDADSTKNAADSETDDEDTKDDDSDGTDADDDSDADSEETDTGAAEDAPAPAAKNTAAAPDSFEPSEPHADEVPVDEPVAPKAPRPRKTKPAEDLGFDLGLTPDIHEAVETAVTSDGFTRLVATAYIGIGNKLFIRGSGPGLSWDKGVPLQFVSIGKWRWETPDATAPVTAKLYKNDQIECTGLGTLTLKPGHQHDVNAGF